MINAFFELHSGLDREGPGEPADVAWATSLAGVRRNARICDAGCGVGADIPALLDAAPEGKLTAIDKHMPFVDDVLARFGDDPRVTAYKGDMARLKGPFDFIWCAGAVYFLGIRKALNCWRPALAPGGAVAFSQPAYFSDTPSRPAEVYWGEHKVRTREGIAARIAEAGYVTLGARVVSDTAWEAYYGPLEKRIAALRPNARPEMAAVLDAAQAEADTWGRVKAETGYLLSVVRPA